MKTRNKPYTSHELFHLINAELKEKGKLPSFLDYGIASGKEDRRILTHFWDVTFKVRFGGSEGIYLDMFLSGELDDSGTAGDCLFGTYKTLNSDDESFRQMALLGAEFALETNQWLRGKLDDFIWTGYDISFQHCGKEKYRVTSYDCIENVQRYLPAKAEHIQHDRIVITENATGKVVLQINDHTQTEVEA